MIYPGKIMVLLRLCMMLFVGMISMQVASSNELQLPAELKQIADINLNSAITRPISRKYINSERHRFLARIKIQNNKVTINDDARQQMYSSYILAALQRIATKYVLPDTTLLMYLGDGAIPELYTKTLYRVPSHIPVFTFAADLTVPNSNQYILFPDPYTLSRPQFESSTTIYWQGWQNIASEVRDASTLEWHEKKPQLVWRGVLSDCLLQDSCENSPRLALVRNFQDDPRIDAEFATMYLYMVHDKVQQYKHLYTENLLSKAEQISYKYLLTIDGMTSTYPGYLWRLYSNSVVVKQESTHVQWFYPLFKPYEHYVPVAHNLKDLTEKLDWLADNDAKAKQIAENATGQVEKYLMPEMIDAYMVYIIRKYAEMVKIIDE